MATHHETRQDVPGDAPVLKSWIGGQWVEGSTGELYPDINPATGELLAQTSVAGAAEVDRAVRTAQAAFKDWRAMPAPRRGGILV
ncbi:MAG: aldehyde dehydrogenase family protein, partial [Limnochordales bacterium]